MHEIVHKWTDGYGAALELTYIPSLAFDDHSPAAHAQWEVDPKQLDVFVDARDLRELAATALAMARLLESKKEGGNE